MPVADLVFRKDHGRLAYMLDKSDISWEGAIEPNVPVQIRPGFCLTMAGTLLYGLKTGCRLNVMDFFGPLDEQRVHAAPTSIRKTLHAPKNVQAH